MAEKQNTPEIRFEGFTDPWEQRKLGSIAASFDYGLNAAATEYDGQNKYLRITDIDDTTHEFLKSDLTTPLADLAMSADYLLEEGDLLFARTGASVGKTYLYRQYDGTVYFAGFLIRARIGESADPEFVYQATLTDAYKKYVAITSQRSGQPGVNAQEYADYQLMLPSRTEQQQIGMTLRSLDNLITLHQRKYDKLCTVKKSMLDKMFPKLGETEPEIRFEGFTDPWEQRKLGEFSKKRTTKNADGALSETFTNSAEQGVINQLDYFDHDITNDANISGYYVVQPDDFVYNPRISATAPCGPINRNRLDRAGVMSPLYTVFSVDASVDKTYLEHYFKTSRWHDFMFLEGNSGARSDRFSISDATFFEMQIWCPEISEQKAIAKQLETADHLITLHQRKLELLRNIKKSLLDRMFV
ncbi:MAG: restriction endonuclease subunit S [Atopobiaceae bacterium]